MTHFLVAGLINIETTLRVEGFPLHYNPVNYPFYRVASSVSGVGYNLAKALTTLGNKVHFLALIGNKDIAAPVVRAALNNDQIDDRYVLASLAQTPQSVILYDGEGRRQIHVDLKDIQETAYPPDLFEQAMMDSQVLVMGTVNFARPFLVKAHRSGKLVATDVHTIADLEDDYNRDYMQFAQILFMSHEKIPAAPEAWARQVMARYGNEIVVIGMGAKGCLLAVRKDNFFERIPAVVTRPVVNTIGGGDALFSAFLHATAAGEDPYTAIRKAGVFASYKIGAVSAADGFLSAEELDNLI
jgi:acarbose 7IV-phosphotransferase